MLEKIPIDLFTMVLRKWEKIGLKGSILRSGLPTGDILCDPLTPPQTFKTQFGSRVPTIALVTETRGSCRGQIDVMLVSRPVVRPALVVIYYFFVIITWRCWRGVASGWQRNGSGADWKTDERRHICCLAVAVGRGYEEFIDPVVI